VSGPKAGWFERQKRSVEKEVAGWPNWKRRAAGLKEKPMTKEELRAAAEMVVATGMNKDWADTIDAGAVAVCRAWLAEQDPADDEELLTGQWLESVGIFRGAFEDRCYGYHYGARCHTLHLKSPRGSVSNIDVYTRGDVRRLFAALGLTLGATP
jgi:hypothetical protein